MPRPQDQQGSLKDGFRHLKRYQRLHLDAKIRYANRMIQRVLAKHGNPVVCWSGGKDSTVLLHLALQQAPDIPVVFNDTGVEFPETREFVNQVANEWHINLYVARPKRGQTFWNVVEEYGWPILGKEQSSNVERGRRRVALALEGEEYGSDSNGFIPLEKIEEIEGLDKLSEMELVLVSHDVEISTRCCHFLKELPTKEMEAYLGADCKILGIMASESRRRSLLWIDHGDYYYVKRHYTRSRGIWKASPLSIWTEDDVWAYNKRFDLPYCEIYDLGHDRNGCWTCAMGVRFGQLKRLRQSHPRLFEYLMTRREMGRELLKAKVALNSANLDADLVEDWAEAVDIAHLLAQRPCFFDTL
jgi:3'-phosphoadenosine 5'-phosphosulfate sulfotransferase (PAPS reductase)/FAD synthetase